MLEIWNKIIKNLQAQPCDLPTTPKSIRTPIWFYTYTNGTNIFVEKSKDKVPSSKITKARRLTYDEFEKIYPIYLQREQDEAVSQEAIKVTYNQVYWYSIIKHCTY